MKKAYLQPSVEEYQIRMRQVLMTSSYQVFNEEYNEETMTDLARSFDFDDEEFE